MGAMGITRLAPLLLVYVTLDFANPLMPGAVRFDGGSVDAVHADRPHPLTPMAPVDLVPTPENVVDRAPRVQASGRPSLVPERRRRAVARIRRAPPSPSHPTAPSEDH
jgi:hypothetical protein